MDDIAEKLYQDVTDVFGKEKLTISRIVVLTPRIISVIQTVGTVHKLSGQEKKQLFFEILKKIVSSADLTEDEKDSIEAFVDAVLPYIVDAIVFAYKSDVFKRIKKKAKKCFASCTN